MNIAYIINIAHIVNTGYIINIAHIINIAYVFNIAHRWRSDRTAASDWRGQLENGCNNKRHAVYVCHVLGHDICHSACMSDVDQKGIVEGWLPH